MLPKYLLLKGFRSYLNTHIDFTQFGDICCLVGENGNGKSSIIEALTTCLFWRNNCTDNKGAGMDAVINSECDSMELEYAFEMNGINYIINTKKQKGQSRTLDFIIDGVSQSEKVSETQQKINDVIKMNYDTFLDTVCIGQGQASRFMNKKPSERKETLMQILDIKKYEEYEKVAKEHKKALKSQMDIINAKLDVLIDNDFSIINAKEEILKLETDNDTLSVQLQALNMEIEKVLKEKSQYELAKQQRDYIINTRITLQNDIETLKMQIDKNQQYIINNPINNHNYEQDIINADKELDSLKEDISNVKSEIASLTTKQQFAQEQMDVYKQKFIKLKDYNQGECELCGQLITEQSKQTHLSKWKSQILDYQNQIESINNEIDNLKRKGSEISANAKQLIADKNEAQTNAQNQNKQLRLLDNIKQDTEIKLKMYEDKKSELDNNMKLIVAEVELKEFNDKELREEYNDVQSVINNNIAKIAIINNNINNFLSKQQEMDDLKKQLAEVKEQYSDYNSLVTAFGKNGITAQIIEHDIPELEYEINNVLSLLSNNSLSVKLVTSKKDEKKIDTFDIYVNDINGVRIYETYSGGEKFRVDFACHIGLSKFLTKRSGASIDFLMIDEGLGSQDDSAKQKFIESINALKSIFKQTMVITHIQDLQNSFVNKVFVQKDQLKGSYVEIA